MKHFTLPFYSQLDVARGLFLVPCDYCVCPLSEYSHFGECQLQERAKYSEGVLLEPRIDFSKQTTRRTFLNQWSVPAKAVTLHNTWPRGLMAVVWLHSFYTVTRLLLLKFSILSESESTTNLFKFRLWILTG